MNYFIALITIASIFGQSPLNEPMAKEISYITTDGIKIYGDLYEVDKKAITILLFHQGGSNARAEYKPIIPKLIGQGYNVLVTDQRSGGQLYGSYNRTVADLGLKRFSYCDAYADIEGALNYILETGFTGKKIIWGSSYSATLVIKLAHEKTKDISGVLAFSPASGEPMEGCRPEEYFPSLKVPLLLLRPSREMEIESVKSQFELAKTYHHQVYEATNGRHGSSMLVDERIGESADATWKVVNAFLKNL
ncbi:alpha/beta hydrolase family protein [Fulvivirga lutimaris]|uniref:alpha/beta hydrolase family protein n=1 Tax=Fulvivirga lutimaris TaxID=1819566 RepID=UPI0012BBBB55|nr:hypothetical protein [Fulvivirga lutimaris]MTI41210.1 hypothetical protein [Fulvivirga lutimaris]